MHTPSEKEDTTKGEWSRISEVSSVVSSPKVLIRFVKKPHNGIESGVVLKNCQAWIYWSSFALPCKNLQAIQLGCLPSNWSLFDNKWDPWVRAFQLGLLDFDFQIEMKTMKESGRKWKNIEFDGLKASRWECRSESCHSHKRRVFVIGKKLK
jgi:hypothetical protein